MKLNRTTIPLALACLALPGTFEASLQAGITDDLVMHLTFDTDYADSTANHTDGTPFGDPALTAGILGKAATLGTIAAENTFNYVALGTPELLNFGSDVDFTVAFWTKYGAQPEGSDDPALIAAQNWASSNNQGWGIYMQSGGNFRVVVTDDRGSAGKMSTTTTPVIRDGTWHHVIVTFARKGDATIYVDGAAYSTKSLTAVTGSIDKGDGTNIGQDNTGFYDSNMANVLMDDVGIWRRVLSPGEVSAIYNAGKTGKNIEQVPAIPDPFVQSTTPAANAAGVSPDTTIGAVIVDGLNRLNTNSVTFKVNGVSVPVSSVVRVGANTTVSCQPAGLLPSGVTTVDMTFANDAASPKSFTSSWSFTSTYVTLTAATKVAPDASKPGFNWRVFVNSANTTDDNLRTEQALAGLLVDGDGNPLPNNADPASQGAASGPSSAPNPENAAISFSIPTVINLSILDGDTMGSFTPDSLMPGVPGIDGATTGISAEIITYIDLPAGLTTMAVASDDGFKTTAGWPLDAFSAATVGEYNGGRGVTETRFQVVAAEAGTYAFRTTYENGGGAGNIEWYSFKADGSKVLINDTANGGLRAYRGTTTPVPPVVQYVDPPAVPRQLNLVSRSLLAILTDGSSAVNDGSIALAINGKPVTVTKKREGKSVKVTWAPTTLVLPGDQYTAELSFTDAGGTSRSSSWKFYNLKNLVLPAPKVTENFDAYEEGSVPAGWNAWNFTSCSGGFCQEPGLDLDNLNSDSYKGWIVVSRDRLNGLKSRIFQVAPGEALNGTPLTVDDLSTGNLLYAESDVRDGSQVQFLISSPFNLAAITNVVLSFGSLYEQNQDSIGAVEYSVDGGANWLPVVYFIDTKDSGGDIRLKPDGSVDAVRTLTDANGDTATWVDNGVNKGGKYGDGIAAPITDALGPFITARWNDNPSVDKRLEAFRLPQAGKKADVRLRFAQLGTGSWYFGVDNLSFYEDPAPVSVTKAVLNVPVLAGGNVTLSWTGTGTLQEAASVTGPWTNSANQANPQTTPATGAAKYYRISQ